MDELVGDDGRDEFAPGRASKTCNWAECEPMSKTPSSISRGYPRPGESCLAC
jgi:hypothetical protein